ncbi:hypothetical protein B0H11DRAFT_1908958 [Mycena galericulata]|nr:hypothetical protein B0H11DRAFT_1908958 [Mycena galericulata]
MWSLPLLLASLLVRTLAAPASSEISTVQRRTTLSDGSAYNQGTIGSMIWQASGVLETGCTLSTISDCYHMYLTSNTSDELVPNFATSPRQRDEFHFPQLAAGTAYSYTWKQYLYSSTSTGSTWFHIMQAFGVVEDDPLVTLDAVSDTLRIKDYVRGTGGPSCGSAPCPITNLTNYHGTTTTHQISGSFGPSGTLLYNVTNESGDEILSYSVNGDMGAGGGYVKFGLYRLVFDEMTTANAVVGDWVIG